MKGVKGGFRECELDPLLPPLFNETVTTIEAWELSESI